MALRSIRIRFVVSLVTLLLASLSLNAQTYRLYIAWFNEPEPSVQLIDSTDSPTSEPAFHPQTADLFYSKQQAENHEIISFNPDSGKRHLVFTSTTPIRGLRATPDGKALTFFGPPSSNELKRLSLEGGLVNTIPGSFSIQNYLWIDANNLLTIEPGEPNTLTLLSLRPFRQIPVARHVGSTLTHVPKLTSFAFVHKLSVDSWSIKMIGPDGSISILAETLPESELFFIAADGAPIVYYEDQLHRYDPGTKKWKPVNLEIPGKVTAMQPAPGGEELAFWVKINP